MANNDFFVRLKGNPHPVVVDFWAPWCAPCRFIAPAVQKLEKEYEGRVDVWQVNADEQPELLQALKVYGIPTLVAFRDGQEVMRKTGAASAGVLAGLFEAALSGEKPVQRGPRPVDRALRLGIGAAMLALAAMNGLSRWDLVFIGLGGVVMFSAVYDRCPVWQALVPRLKALFRHEA